MRVTDKGEGDVIIHGCRSWVGEFEQRGREFGKREDLRDFVGRDRSRYI